MSRSIKAQRGDTLRCKGWRQEAILRLLENNLETGEHPEDLVVYSGARAARDWDAFDVIVRSLKALEDDETLVIQSGKPVGKFRCHVRAPRVIMANGNVLGRYAGEKECFALERKGLTYWPGMTAAAWQYIGSQGILQGTYQSFAGAGRRFFGGNLRGRSILTAGCGGMGGAQPLAGKMAGAAILVVDADPSRIERRVAVGYCDRMTSDLTEAVRWIEEAKAAGAALSVGLVGNAAVVYPELLAAGFQPDVMTDQVMTDPYAGYIPAGMSAEEARDLLARDPETKAKRAKESLLVHARALLEFRRRGAVTFEYGNNLRMRAADAGLKEMLEVPSFITLFIRPLFCEGRGPFRWIAISGNPQDIEVLDELAAGMFPDDHPIRPWIALAKTHVPIEGLPARIGWLGYGERSRFALAVNEAVAAGRVSGPVAFTRDQLDSGSVANPLRETEAMPDGSDPIADWPLLNGMLACAGGADVVALHGHGNRAQSAGQTVIADGTAQTADRLRAVLDGDSGIGVIRHAEAGYPRAQEIRGASPMRLPGGDR